MKRGEIYTAKLPDAVGSEQGGWRPVVIVQNDVGNEHSPTTIVCPLTSSKTKHRLPTHISISAAKYGLYKNSIILVEQIITVDKSRLVRKLCTLDDVDTERLNRALFRSIFNIKEEI